METKKIYLLYRGDAWLSTASLTLIAPFTTFEKAVDYLHKKSREYGIDRDAVAQFKSIRQTQGLEENFYCEELGWTPNPKQMSSTTASSSMVSRNFHEVSWSRFQCRSVPRM